jgi:hypothetical protein
MVMTRDLDSLENYATLWDDVWMMPKERDDNGKATSTEELAAESD